MNPDDEAPIPSEPVLSEEETLRQLQADFVRKYTDEIKRLRSTVVWLVDVLKLEFDYRPDDPEVREQWERAQKP